MRTATKSIFLLSILAFPATAVAAAVISVDSPAIAGLGTQVRVRGLQPSQAVHISVQTADGDEILLPAQADATGEAREELRGSEMQRAGQYAVQAEADGKRIAGPESFEVLPDSVDIRRSAVMVEMPVLRADGIDTAEVRVVLQDRYGNALSGRPVSLLSSRTVDEIQALSQHTDLRGEMRFLVSTMTAGSVTLRAIDLISGMALGGVATIEAQGAVGGQYAASVIPSPRQNAAYAPRETFYPSGDSAYAASVRPGMQMFYAQTNAFDVIDHFELLAPNTLPAGEEAPRFIVRAVDKSGHTVEDYVGTIVFSSTDPSATLPNFGTYTFKDRDLGQKEFPLVLKFGRGGLQKLRVEDKNDPSILGEASILVEGNSAAPSQIVVNYPKNGDAVSTTTIIVEGKGPTFANLIVMGGVQDVPGATDKDGNFSIPVQLAPGKREFTLRVRDDAGRNDSGPIDIILDDSMPQIVTIKFAPERPNSGEKVLVVVESEPKLQSITMKLDANTEPLTLVENTSASGSYQAFFTAPEIGSYQPTVTATDKAGNTMDLRTTLTVGMPSLAIVQNLRGEARMGAANLEWDPLEASADIDGYRIYVGEKPDNFLYTLDTGRVTTKVTVAGLLAGRTYYFAATAVKEKQESAEKSRVLQLEIPGLVLDVKPGDGQLLIEWTPPKVSLQSYTLEFGAQEGNYTEKRVIPAKKTDDGKPQVFTLTDLINGVTYYLRLTPITVTGDALTDLAATGNGSPQGNGAFQAGPNDPIPFDIGKTTPATNALKHTPSQAESGLPYSLWVAIALAVIGGCAYQWHRRQMLRQSAAFLHALETQHRR